MHPAIRRQTLADILRRSAARDPDKTAIVCGDTQLDLRPVPRRLRARRRRPGRSGRRRRATASPVLARNSHAFAALRFALARLGAVLVPINFMLKADEVGVHPAPRRRAHAGDGQRAGRARPRCRGARHGGRAFVWLPGEEPSDPVAGMLTLRRTRGERNGAAPEVELAGSDLAQIVYTSGTESLPKGAMLTHDAVHLAVRELHRRCRASRATTSCCMRCRCITARSSTCSSGPSLYVGATNVITAKPTPDNLLPLIERHRHHLVLRAAHGVDRAAALAAVRRDRSVVACARATTARRSCRWRCCASSQRRLPQVRLLEPVRPDRDRAAGDRCSAPRTSCASPARADARRSTSRRASSTTTMHDVAAGRGRRDRAPLAAPAAGLLPRRRAHAGRVRGRLVPLRRPRDDRRRGLHHRRRSQEGHDQDRRRERRQPRGRGSDLPAAGSVRGGGDRRCRIRSGSRRWRR